MNSLRIAMVTRRFWPLVGGAEMVMANLAAEFLRQGHQPRVVTAQWESDWPTDVVHREVPVVRIPNPARRGWGTLRYMVGLNRWLRRHIEEIDVVYVSMLKHDAYAAITTMESTRVPVVVRAEGAGATGDCHWHETGRFGIRIRRCCRRADRLIAPSPTIADEMLAAGFEAERIERILNGVAIPPPRHGGVRGDARAILVEVNHDLAADDQTPVVVYTGRLDAAKGLHELIRAWPIVLATHPTARLWIVGEGPDRDALFDTIRDCDVRQQVAMPGAFDDVQDVLNAADLFVLPSHQEGISIALLEAMAAGVPVVASDIPGNRSVIEPGIHGLLMPARDVQSIAKAITVVLSDPRSAAQRAATARRRVELEFSLDQMARMHLDLFQQVIAERQ
ncbi:MAG: Alpha-D-kanosaminyltransferase [Planctomycetota bacterium]